MSTELMTEIPRPVGEEYTLRKRADTSAVHIVDDDASTEAGETMLCGRTTYSGMLTPATESEVDDEMESITACDDCATAWRAQR